MSDVYSSAGPQGACGAATARAREHETAQDEQTRGDRISELRRQYLEGTYQVDAQQLSAAILRRHLAKEKI